MPRPRRWSTSFGAVLAALWAGLASAQTPAGTAFTYQGRLLDGGSPASGAYDVQFTLFAAPAGGTQVGPVLVQEDVTISGGLFSVSLDFGPDIFTGDARWLEVGVRPGSSTGPFTLVGPRQELQPAPHAVFSATAPWSGLILVPAGFADGVDDDSGGDITGVAAGSGLTGGATSGNATLDVDFTGSSGSASAAARSDHNHLGQTWNGSGIALNVQSSSPGGVGVYGYATAPTGFGFGLYGVSTSIDGRGVGGLAAGGSGTTFGVYGQADSPDGRGVYGFHASGSGTEAGVRGETNSTSSGAVGVMGMVSSTAPGGNSAAVRGVNNGTGPLGIGVWGSQAGSGWGVNGTSVSGIGVRGQASSSSGIGVVAQGGGTTGTALAVSNGAIQVPGAGIGTNTPVFVHDTTTATNCQYGFSNYQITVLDNPYVNGNPSVILIVTQRSLVDFLGSISPLRVGYGDPCGVTNRWGIVWDPVLNSEAFNVLIIKP